MAAPQVTTFPVLYEDECVLAIDKPAGVISHPNRHGEQKKCAFEGRYEADTRCFASGPHRTWLVHRLDSATSGILLAAKQKKICEALRDQFRERTIKKAYLAVVCSLPLQKEGVWRDHIHTRTRQNAIRSTIASGKRFNAELHYRVLEKFPEHALALLEFDLKTGRTHQIRVQAAARKYHILGDRTYGNFQANRRLKKILGINRLFLHSKNLKFTHPRTLDEIAIESSCAPELQDVLDRLRQSKNASQRA